MRTALIQEKLSHDEAQRHPGETPKIFKGLYLQYTNSGWPEGEH